MDHRETISLDSTLPKHSDIAILSVTLALFCAGPILGLALAWMLAPGSAIALLIGLVLLPCAHLAGRFAWAAMGFVVDRDNEVRRAIRALGNLGRWIRERRTPSEKVEQRTSSWRVLREGAIFVLVHAMFALAAGLIIGLVLTETPTLTVVCAYTLTGTLYGATVYVTALKGFLLIQLKRQKT